MNAMVQSLRPMLNALSLMLFFFFLFAILGVQLFAGTFHYCRDVSLTPMNVTDNIAPFCDPRCDTNARSCGPSDCFSCFEPGDSFLYERRWDNRDQNFDNVINAMVTLFEISTSEGWADIALYAVDATGTDTWPVKDNARWRVIYFVVFMMVGAFFAVQLFAGVACDKYLRMNEFYNGTLFLTEKQVRVWNVLLGELGSPWFLFILKSYVCFLVSVAEGLGIKCQECRHCTAI